MARFQDDVSGRLHALEQVASQLESWNTHSPSVTGYLIEDIPAGHPLHSAVASLEQFYGGALPRPALRYWRRLLRHARHGGDEAEEPAEDAAEWLQKWVRREIDNGQPDTPPEPDTTPKRRGRPKADDKTVQREAELVADWEQARESGVYKADFAKDNEMKMREFNALLSRVAKRKSRSDK